MADLFQVHLTGLHFSGRGVRLRELDPDEVDKVARIAAKEVGTDATVIEFNARRQREGALRMVVAVTEKAGLSAEQVLTATWMPVTQQELEDEKGKKRLSALFTSKDVQALCRLYQRRHELSLEELDAIEGKALPVSTD